MPTSADIVWFKKEFQSQIEPALAGTPLTVDFITALACQETGELWTALRRKPLTTAQILALCVGDTLDADKGRRAFPTTRDDLLGQPRGEEMFAIAREALVNMAAQVPAYSRIAARPGKFCHGFGLFQLDLQFFREDPAYFLQKDYERFDRTLEKCVISLKRALKKLGFEERTSLTDLELAAVGIAYNTGGYKPAKGLKQGHFNGKHYYGEAIFDYIQLAHTVAGPDSVAALNPPAAGKAIIPPPSPVTATGEFFKVETREGTLRLRSAPKVSSPPQANVIGHLPDGHVVRAIAGTSTGAFMQVETSLAGALLRGFASVKFLTPAPGVTHIPVVEPAPALPASGVVAVLMPRRPNTVTRRVDVASAHSLNETGNPKRAGATAEELRRELAAIIDWLAVDRATHKRYQPRDGLTFCNIYSHDFCHLAGAYLPRVWWTAKALISLSAGTAVEPLIGETIVECRANDLFRWLRDFGPMFGWRQTGTLTKLQTSVNQGAVGLIVARRKDDGRSGHVVVVVPETDDERAKRDVDGEVTLPLQSQAGTHNFRYGKGRADWWRGSEFAESAFWLHA